jgi:hypothetical protein
LLHDRQLTYSTYEDLVRRWLLAVVERPSHHLVALQSDRGKLSVVADLHVPANQGRLARIEFMSVDHSPNVRPKQRLMIDYLLDQAHRLQADAVIIGTMLNDGSSLNRLSLLRKEGFSVVSSNLILHRWQTDEMRIPLGETSQPLQSDQIKQFARI